MTLILDNNIISGGKAETTPVVNNLISTDVDKALSAAMGKKLSEEKQVHLKSGSNIKTINNESLLGSGNLQISEKTVRETTVQDNLNLDLSLGKNAFQ